jgi:pimeloyl-ACP methyl ester carboxylesterase
MLCIQLAAHSKKKKPATQEHLMIQLAKSLASRMTGALKPGEPVVILMHFLGGSQREWDEVITLIDGRLRSITVDLPGFGDSNEIGGYSVSEMADAVEDVVREEVSGRYILVGHSMSGKVSMVLAARAQRRGDNCLAGLLLVAPSPPSPEPMGDDKRSMMMELLGNTHENDRARARQYITKNELRDISSTVEARASAEVLRMNRAAWNAWLTDGSKEDWADFVGMLDVPAMVLAGEKDLSLGPKQQQEFTMPHLRFGILRTVPNCSHLIPMECPSTMAKLLEEFHGTV